eukprot:c32653_g1_i1 orf=2-223(-)
MKIPVSAQRSRVINPFGWMTAAAPYLPMLQLSSLVLTDSPCPSRSPHKWTSQAEACTRLRRCRKVLLHRTRVFC